MYGHGWWDDMKGQAVCDYMHKNSHREFDVAYNAQYMRPVRQVAPAYYGDAFKAPFDIEERPRYLPYGLDPVGGGIIWKLDRFMHDPDVVAGQASTVRASWDYEIPTVDKMCEFFDAHFGKRNDLMNWLERGPLLLAEAPRREFLETKPKGAWGLPSTATWFEALQLIDAFRKHPNEYWERSRHENRRDAAARVLETSKGE